MPDSPLTTRRMQATPRQHTKPELRLQALLRQARVRFATDAAPLTSLRRKADLVFRSAKVAVFVDGCFWHGCPTHCTWPANNRAWWKAKIARNRTRDADTTRRLKASGWTVIRVWEHAVTAATVRRIVRRLEQQRARPRRSTQSAWTA